MPIPETPPTVSELDLMRRLDAYADGHAYWLPGQSTPGPGLRASCRALHTHLTQLVNELIAPLLDRSTSREMETFTMHDRGHGLKVAHLMWQIIAPERRERLTPPEIGLLVASAFLHDLGMTLSNDERAARLDRESDLWDRLEVQERQRAAIEELRTRMGDQSLTEGERDRARRALTQAEEALLAQDTRERHATHERYREIVAQLDALHRENRVAIADLQAALAFDGQSFLDKLIEVCVSHNRDAEYLVKRDPRSPERPLFPRDYPIGASVADVQLVAAALRLADILDFDRERTPPVLFHYLLPGQLNPAENRSVLEWGKHLAISSWQIDPDAVVFRGRSTSHVIHHAVVQFCALIAEEIAATRATFGGLGEGEWPFALPATVREEIHAEGYRYVPYRFELDDERIYELLMGGAIYDNPLVAVRELVQNAVDACMLRDALMQLHDDSVQPGKERRIFVRYEEPSADCPQPRLIVTDRGIGMDALVLERYFLKVGRSYYRSTEFSQHRVALRRQGLDFAPVSEFGIGFLSCFLLSDRVIVETAPWSDLRGDARKRTLYIDGPTRLIRLDEQENTGLGRFTGTRIMLELVRGDNEQRETTPPSWKQVRAYLEDVCQDLPYRLHLEYVVNGQVEAEVIDPRPLRVEVPPELEPFAYRIPVDDQEAGLEGEIVLINQWQREHQREVVPPEGQVVVDQEQLSLPKPVLLRGGFKVGSVPGLAYSDFNKAIVFPYGEVAGIESTARLRTRWQTQHEQRFPRTNLARNATADQQRLVDAVERIWISYLVEHVDELPEGLMYDVQSQSLLDFRFRLSRFIARRDQPLSWLERYDAWAIYLLTRNGWSAALQRKNNTTIDLTAWEQAEGEPVSLVARGLAAVLLDRVLPHVTAIVVHVDSSNRARARVRSPSRGWQELLKSWHGWMSNQVSWPKFVEFTGKVGEALLYHNDTSYLNARFRERLDRFTEDELTQLVLTFHRLITARVFSEQASLSPEQASLLHRARATVGDLEIAGYSRTYRIDSFEVPEV